MDKKILAKVVVGSRLHNTNTPDSDWDYRGIHISPIKDLISPFRTLKNTSWIEGDEDNTSYELAEFCKLATKGNATILEVFFSNNIIETSDVHKEMQYNWLKFMDSKNFLSASRGYSQNQYRKMLDYSDVGVKNQPRTAKFIIAFIRVMWQAKNFFDIGEFACQLDNCPYYDFIMEIKGKTKDEIGDDKLAEAIGIMNRLDRELTTSFSKSEFNDITPDIEWIEQFLTKVYTQEA